MLSCHIAPGCGSGWNGWEGGPTSLNQRKAWCMSFSWLLLISPLLPFSPLAPVCVFIFIFYFISEIVYFPSCVNFLYKPKEKCELKKKRRRHICVVKKSHMEVWWVGTAENGRFGKGGIVLMVDEERQEGSVPMPPWRALCIQPSLLNPTLGCLKSVQMQLIWYIACEWFQRWR